jgi:hypothetical protein
MAGRAKRDTRTDAFFRPAPAMVKSEYDTRVEDVDAERAVLEEAYTTGHHPDPQHPLNLPKCVCAGRGGPALTRTAAKGGGSGRRSARSAGPASVRVVPPERVCPDGRLTRAQSRTTRHRAS